jgi:hypothetical protein
MGRKYIYQMWGQGGILPNWTVQVTKWGEKWVYQIVLPVGIYYQIDLPNELQFGNYVAHLVTSRPQ